MITSKYLIGEYTFYAVFGIWVYLFLIRGFCEEIREMCFDNHKCRRYLSDSDFFTKKIDLSDSQWKSIRNSMPILIGALIGSSILCQTVKWGNMFNFPDRSIYLNALLGTLMIFGIHGLHGGAIIFFIVSLAYFLSKVTFRNKLLPISVWSFAIAVLCLKESYRIRGGAIGAATQALFNWAKSSVSVYPWNFPLNFLALRLISYHMDYYWTWNRLKKEESSTELEPRSKDYLDVNSKLLPPLYPNLKQFNFIGYLSFLFFPPLYLAGPLISYNSFICQTSHQRSHNSTSIGYILSYAIRYMIYFIFYEFILHHVPVFAISSSGLYNSFSPAQLSVFAYISLKLMWMKFLLIWRLFRLWSLCCGVAVIENMGRCMSNNYDIKQFWKGWHSSYHYWIVRYIYAPLNGSDHKIVVTALVFVFVAFWHDIEWKLLIWALANTLMYAFLSLLSMLVPNQYRDDDIKSNDLFKQMVSCFLHTIQIIGLIIVNIIGYGVGSGGAMKIVGKLLLSWDGMNVMLINFVLLMIGCSWMRSLRRDGLCEK